MKTIDSIIVAVAVDERDQIEGVCAMYTGNGWMPLIAADDERYEQIRKQAQRVAAQTGKTVRMVRFTERGEIEVINPKGKNNG